MLKQLRHPGAPGLTLLTIKQDTLSFPLAKGGSRGLETHLGVGHLQRGGSIWRMKSRPLKRDLEGITTLGSHPVTFPGPKTKHAVPGVGPRKAALGHTSPSLLGYTDPPTHPS